MVSRLTWDGSDWLRQDLVRGLPRSEENHTGNGMALDPSTNTLYLAQGGNTNKGAPSLKFAHLPEYALSAAILSIDLDQIGDTTYDLPTLDDEDRPGRSRRARSVRRRQREEPGDACARGARPGVLAGVSQPVRRPSHAGRSDVHDRQRVERHVGRSADRRGSGRHVHECDRIRRAGTTTPTTSVSSRAQETTGDIRTQRAATSRTPSTARPAARLRSCSGRLLRRLEPPQVPSRSTPPQPRATSWSHVLERPRPAERSRCPAGRQVQRTIAPSSSTRSLERERARRSPRTCRGAPPRFVCLWTSGRISTRSRPSMPL